METDGQRRLSAGKRVAIGLLGAGATAVLIFAITACHGHRIRPVHLAGDEAFDFRRPPCQPGPLPEARQDDVLIRYLGVSGVYVQWRGVAVLGAPFFTNYGVWPVAFGEIDPDEKAIALGMAGLPNIPIEAVIVGHAHYDHAGDLPVVLPRYAPGATVYINKSGKRMLEGDPDVDNPFVDVTEHAGTWIRPRDASGRDLPLRLMPLESGHAPQARFFRFAEGEVKEDWQGPAGHGVRQMKGGKAFAYLIDLLREDGSVAFRLHYQDAASAAPLGFPPNAATDERDVDLAVVCMPSYWLAPGYPSRLLERVAARHVLMTHYEDFFRPRDKPLRFVAFLTDDRANALVAQVRATLAEHATKGPLDPVCGPGDDGWTMPLPGEWLRFATEDDS